MQPGWGPREYFRNVSGEGGHAPQALRQAPANEGRSPEAEQAKLRRFGGDSCWKLREHAHREDHFDEDTGVARRLRGVGRHAQRVSPQHAHDHPAPGLLRALVAGGHAPGDRPGPAAHPDDAPRGVGLRRWRCQRGAGAAAGLAFGVWLGTKALLHDSRLVSLRLYPGSAGDRCDFNGEFFGHHRRAHGVRLHVDHEHGDFFGRGRLEDAQRCFKGLASDGGGGPRGRGVLLTREGRGHAHRDPTQLQGG
mmetsp:Transcript_3313/g.9672  ORF Transcript_3313/g.9672 Transcript_3313/m.9672 type:complete len:250 (-) Transcript_3313:217-966(-)